jgi:hypothetical protein
MVYFTILASVAMAVFMLRYVFHSLRRHQLFARWWIATVCILLLAIGIGLWSATRLEYQLNVKTRVIGFPLPLVVFVLEGNRWTDFVPPSVTQTCLVVTNVLISIAVALLPLGILANKTRSKESDIPNAQTKPGNTPR